MVKVEDLVLSGEMAMEFKDRVFEVVKKPEYKEFKDDIELDDGTITSKTKRIEEMKVAINKNKYIYRPNKTSVKAMTKMYGVEMDEWVGKRFGFVVAKQNCFGSMKDVITVLFKKDV